MAAFPAIDIDKPGKYPIVLSDALLGKTSKEVYTGVRCKFKFPTTRRAYPNQVLDNHKPDTSSDSASSMRLDPSDSDPSNFDLSYRDSSDKYLYQGVRTSGEGKYVLIFDPSKQHFVLHRVDSTFDMNLVSAPWDQDGSSLRKQYPQIATPQGNNISVTQPPKRKPSTKAKAAIAKAEPAKQRKKPEKITKPKPPPRAPTPEEEEDESDDGLEVEDPDVGATQSYQYRPAPTYQRQDSEDASEEDSDAEGEYEDEPNQDVDHLKLPSPARNAGGMSGDEEIALELEIAIEKELEEALAGGGGADSSESEEE